MSDPLVTAVILNTNRREDTLACLASLQQDPYPRLRMVVLDNSSTDGSAEAIRMAFPRVRMIELTSNLGYAGNNNVGIRAALAEGADWILILNEDVLLAQDAVSQLMAVATNAPGVGVVGPLIYHCDEPTVIQSAGGILSQQWLAVHAGQNEPDQGQYSRVRDVDWVSGCAMLVRREAFEQVGVFDERFFYYWEEVEWCIRARRRGWRAIVVPEAKVWHKGVQRHYQPSANVTYYATRNRLLAMAIHRAPIPTRLLAMVRLLRTLTAWTVKPKWRSMQDHRSALSQGMCDFGRKRWGVRTRPLPKPRL